jgi:hypothetical protein
MISWVQRDNWDSLAANVFVQLIGNGYSAQVAAEVAYDYADAFFIEREKRLKAKKNNELPKV